MKGPGGRGEVEVAVSGILGEYKYHAILFQSCSKFLFGLIQNYMHV